MAAHPALDPRRGYFRRNGALRSPALLFNIAAAALLILTILSIHQARSQGSDSDGDGMPDAWESTHGLSVGSDDSQADPDGDGVPNIREYAAGTNPTLWDSDGDGESDYLHVFGPDAYTPESRASTFRDSSVYPDGSYAEWATSPSHAISKSSYRGDWASAEGFYIGLDPTGVPEYYATWGWGTGGGMNTGTYTYFPDRSSTGSHSQTLPDGTSAEWSWGPGYFYQTISQPGGTAYEGTYSYSAEDGTTYLSAYTLNPDLSSSSRNTEFNASGTPVRSSSYSLNPDGSSVSDNTEFAYDGSPYHTTYSSWNPDGSSNTRTHYHDQDGDGFSDYDEDYIYGTDKYTPDTFDPASPFDFSPQGTYTRTNPDGTVVQWWWLPGYIYSQTTHPGSTLTEQSYTSFDTAGNITSSGTSRNSPDGSYYSISTTYASDSSPYYDYIYTWSPDGTSFSITHYYDQDGDGFSDYDEDMIFGTDKYTPDTFDPASPHDFSPQGTYSRTNPDGTLEQWTWYSGYKEYQLKAADGTPIEGTNSSLDPDGNPTYATSWRYYPDGSYYSITTTYASDGSPYYDYIYTWSPGGTSYSVTHYHDQDGDGLSDYDEDFLYFTSKTQADTDGDGIPDAWEIQYALDPIDPEDAAADPDGDGLSNLAEYLFGLDPNNPETAGGGQGDHAAVFGPNATANFINQDSDGDGIPDRDELRLGLNPLNAADANEDPDGDGRTNLQDFQDTNGSPTATPGTLPDAGGAGAPPATLQSPSGAPVRLMVRWKFLDDYGAFSDSDGGTFGFNTAEDFFAAELPTAWRETSDRTFDVGASDAHYGDQPIGAFKNALHLELKLVRSGPADSATRLNWIQIHRKGTKSYKIVDQNYVQIIAQPDEFSVQTLEIPAGATESETLTFAPEIPALPADVGPVEVSENYEYIEGMSWDTKSLQFMELAPDVLAVNTNFDEGYVDDETDFAIAKPDCENGTLKAARDHLDGKWEEGDIVTDDLHKGFFGLRPGTLPYTETAGAVVKIKKLDKNDPETPRKQSGHVRLYAVWGSQGSESEMQIELYDKDSLVANDIGPLLYHDDPNTPVTYYLEGVEPGKITLEFSYQKGSTSFKQEQEFLVATKKTRAQWREEVVYQIRLQESSFSAPNPYSDIAKITPALGYRNPDPAKDNSRLIALMYYYYAQLFYENQEEFLWPGMARVAAASIYAGMSDMYLWNINFVTGGEPGAVAFVNDFMIPRAQAIFNDLAWVHRAYAASGIYAIKHLDATENGSVSLRAWEILDDGISQNDITKIRDAGERLLNREQHDVIQPYYAAIGPVKFKQPGVNWLWAFWLGGVEVTRDADCKCEIGE